MQAILLLFDRSELGAPISTISPWLDALLHTDDDVFGLLDDQTHRRVIKTHTPLDGVPRVPSVTYIAMSVTHWMSRCRIETMTGTSTSTAWRRSEAAVGQGGTEDALFEDEPEEPDAYLRW